MPDSIPSNAPAITVAAASPLGDSQRRSLTVLRACFLVLLAASAFVFNATLERRLDGLGAFEQLDVIFDTDPNERLFTFTSGGWRQRCVIHPLLRLVSLPIRGAVILADHAGITAAPAGASRRVLAMLVAPVCSALTAIVMFRVFLGAGLGDLAAGAGAILSQVAFSQMIFGSIPDHFVVSGLGMSLVLLCGLVLPTADRIGWPRWLAVGVLTAGVTISQIIPTCLMFAVCCRCGGMGPRQTARATALLGGSSVALVLSMSWLLTFPDTRYSPLSPVTQVALYTRFFPPRPLDHAIGALAAIPNSIAPPPARVIPGHATDTDRYQIRFTLESVRDPVRIAAVWIPFLFGAWLGLRSNAPVRRALCLGAMAIVFYNLLFHALWGKEWFLYSQHWLSPLVFVMAIPLRDAGRYRLPVWLAASFALPLIAAGNWQRFGEIVARLEAEPTVVVAPREASR
jgi:hypothetical protein